MINPKKHPTLNGLTFNSLDRLKLSSERERKTEEWNYIPMLENAVLQLCDENDIDTWKIDWVWKDFMKQQEDLTSENDSLTTVVDDQEIELDDQLNPSDLIYWPFTQVSKMKQEFIQLGVQLATNFDGKEVSDNTKKEFMIMLENSGIYSSTGDNVSSMEMAAVVKKFGTYQTLLTFYGLGSFQNEKFKISELCKYWLAEKKDLISFAGISKNLVLASSVNMIEIWDKENYEEVVKKSLVDFGSLAEEVMGNQSHSNDIS